MSWKIIGFVSLMLSALVIAAAIMAAQEDASYEHDIRVIVPIRLTPDDLSRDHFREHP